MVAVVLTWNDVDMARTCIRSLVGNDYGSMEIVLVDNGSDFPTIAPLERDFSDLVTVQLSENTGFCGGCNAGMKKALEMGADYVFLLNNDTIVDSAAVSELVSVLACPKSAIDELALSCENVLDQMDVSCGFARFTATTWSGRPGPYGELGAIAQALVDAYERQAGLLVELLDRLAPLAEEGEHDDHEDLDPRDVLDRVGPMLEAPDDAAA